MNETFKIENDKTADWAISQIKEAEAERDRLVALAEDQIVDLTDRIQELNDKCERDTAYLKSCLYEYFEKVEHKVTKTQESYKLLSGTLVFKKPSVKITHDDEKLLEFLKKSDRSKFIKIKESIDWAEFKKTLVVSDNDVIDSEIGEVIDGCSVEEVTASFDVKF